MSASASEDLPNGAMTVPLDNLTAAQLSAFDVAKKYYLSVNGVLDEYELPFLVKHLVAANWKPAKAEKSLLRTAKWRRESGADGIRAKLRQGDIAFATFPHCLQMLGYILFLPAHTRTRRGNVASFVQLGSIADPTKWLDEMTDDESVSTFRIRIRRAAASVLQPAKGRVFESLFRQVYFNTHILEYFSFLCDVESTQKRTLLRSSVVYDAKGCHFRQLSARLVRRLNKIAPIPDLYYPELVGETFVLNAPWVIHSLWAILKNLMSREIQARVLITSENATAETLLQHVSAAEVPAFITAGECAAMPPAVAAELGFASLDAARLSALLVNRGSCIAALGEYRIGLDAAAQETVTDVTDAALIA